MMSQMIVSNNIWRAETDRIGFRRKSGLGLKADFKACCARLGRMDLFHAFESRRRGYVAVQRAHRLAMAVLSGRQPLSMLEAYATQPKIPSAPGVYVNNIRYEMRARTSARSTVAPGHARATKADAALALPDLFPDDDAP